MKKNAMLTLLTFLTLCFLLSTWPALTAAEGTTKVQVLKGTETAASSSSDIDFGRPHPEAAPELAQFAFLIGEWTCDIDYTSGDWTSRIQSKAAWKAYYVQDGRAIMDDFKGGFGDGYWATTIRAFDRQAKGWRGYWLDGPSGSWSRPLAGSAVDDGMLLETSTQAYTPDGSVIDVALQYHFYDITPDRFHWRQNASVDGGKTWRRDTTIMDCRRQTGPKS